MTSVLNHPTLSEQILPLTVETYHALGQMGLVEQRTELIRGFVFPKLPKSPLHGHICQVLIELLRALLPAGFMVRQEQPITCSDSEPEPDVAIVAGILGSFVLQHPTTAELIIEVSISTLDRDLAKAEIYAEAGVPEYWLINPESAYIEVFTAPSAQGYGVRTLLARDDTLTSLRFPGVTVPVRDLLG